MGLLHSIPGDGFHAWHLVVVAGLLYLISQFVLAIYNAYFGPLSNFPGSKFAAACRIPMLRMIWAGDMPSTMLSLHEKYGPVVRTTPTTLSYNCPEAWKDIYGHRFGGKQSFVKDPEHYGPTKSGESSIINTSDEDHSRVRRILANSFSDKALKEQEPLLQHWAELLVEKLRMRAEKGESVDMASYYNFTTFDVMADLTFAEPLNMLEGSEYSPWVKTIFASIKIASRMRVLTSVPGLGKLILLLLGPIAKRKQAEHDAYTDERVDRRMAKEPERPDLWSHILKRLNNTEGGLSLAEMHSNASIFMIAGTETTATLLSGLTYYLMANTDKLAKLCDEVRTAFATDSELTVESLARLKYLNACLEEGLRMYPPVPDGLPRIVPEGGATICGEFVPSGTSVSVHQWASYRSTINFHRPDEFLPERWLKDGPEEFANDNKAAFNPFSFGPRNCLGRNLAYHEARLLLTKTLWNFDIELVDPQSRWNDQKIFFLWDKPALMVNLKPVTR